MDIPKFAVDVLISACLGAGGAAGTDGVFGADGAAAAAGGKDTAAGVVVLISTCFVSTAFFFSCSLMS